MWLIAGIVGGATAGVIMGVASEIGYRLGMVKSHLVIVDGSFALRMLGQGESTAAIYATGTLIHIVTSIIFGIVYVIIARFTGFDPVLPAAVTVYVLVLWLAMLAVALPAAGQGFLGSRIRRSAWLEQLVLHIVFGIGFWWALGII